MIKASFGIKIFWDCDLLLTADDKLVHYGNGTRGLSTTNAPSNVYFFIKDESICIEQGDPYYVTDVIELSKIPIYKMDNPKFNLCEYDNDSKKIIDESKICLLYFFDESKLRFFLHLSYKGNVYNNELDNKELSLLKYTWLTSKDYSFEGFNQLGDKLFDYISSINIDKIIKEMNIISGDKTFYGRDSESYVCAERWLIETDDYYILNSLLNISENLYPRSIRDNTNYMYGSASSKMFNMFNKKNLLIEAELKYLDYLIAQKSNGLNESQSIKYIILKQNIINKRLPYTLSIQICELDSESSEDIKSQIIKNTFTKNYSVGKHIAGLIYLRSEAIKVPNNILNETIASYLEWKLVKVQNSGLRNLTIYWSAKEICYEFNIRSNNRFNFNIDFSDFQF